jgi:hypothetical protein
VRASRLTGARLEGKLAAFHQTFGIESVEMLADGPTRREYSVDAEPTDRVQTARIFLRRQSSILNECRAA